MRRRDVAIVGGLVLAGLSVLADVLGIVQSWRTASHALPRSIVTTFLREHDFRAAWRVEWMAPLSDVARSNDVEDRFIDDELEQRRVELQEAVSALGILFATETFRQEGRTSGRTLVCPRAGRATGKRRRGPRRSAALNDAATRAADAYDALIDKAREKTLL